MSKTLALRLAYSPRLSRIALGRSIPKSNVMLLGKLLLQMTAVLMAVLPAILDYTWHDKRTVKFKRTRLALYLLCFFALIVSAVVTVQDERANERQVQELTTRLDDLRRQSEAAAKKNESAAAEQRSQMQLLITGNQKLQETLAPLKNWGQVDSYTL